MTRHHSIADLHKLAIARGFPAAEVHEILHEFVVATYGVASMRDLSARQRADLAATIRLHNGRPSYRRGEQPAGQSVRA